MQNENSKDKHDNSYISLSQFGASARLVRQCVCESADFTTPSAAPGINRHLMNN